MKKYIVIPLSICLLLIFLGGCFIYDRYSMQVETQKKLLMSYVSETKTHLDVVRAQVRELPHIVKPFISEINSQNVNIAENFPGYISLLEQFYIENAYFIWEISAFNMSGDVFNIKRENDESIIDVYKARTASVLRSGAGLSDVDKFAIILPVYQGDFLAGNVAVYLDIGSLLHELFEPYSELQNVWLTAVFDAEAAMTLPLDNEWSLSHENAIAKGVCELNAGFLQNKIEPIGHVVTYYENLIISEHCIGIAFSYNISALVKSSLNAFVILAVILLSITIVASFVMTRLKVKYAQMVGKKDSEIGVWNAIHRNTPVGIAINRENVFFSSNDYFVNLFEHYHLLPDCFHKDHEYDDWEICKFENHGKEVSVGKRQVRFDFDNNSYCIETFWEISEMEQRLKDALQSAITKSELLSRVGGDVKKTLDNVKCIAALLMREFPHDVQIEQINKLSAHLCMMLTEVQEYAEIEAGHVVLKEVPFNLVDEIKKLTDKHLPEMNNKGIELQTYVAPSAIRKVVGDPQYFRQILNELLSNAIKFTEKGSIRISLETAHSKEEKIMVKCSVEDTGIGISRKKIKSIFSFDHTLSSMDENDPVGLGVVIIKKLVEIMGGTMRVASPSPISTDPSTPGAIFSFSIACVSDQIFNKKLDYSKIVSHKQLNVLIVTTNAQHVSDLADFLKNKQINSDVFIYAKDSSELLVNKLIIDKDRYQIVVISAETGDTSLKIANVIHQKDFTRNCLYALIDAHDQKGNYIKARYLNMDYYFVNSDILSGFDDIFNTHFPNLES